MHGAGSVAGGEPQSAIVVMAVEGRLVVADVEVTKPAAGRAIDVQAGFSLLRRAFIAEAFARGF